MKITSYNNIRSVSTIRKKPGANTSSFEDFLDSVAAGDTSNTASLSDITGASALGNMLSLQEISEEEGQRKRALSQGKSMLDVLDQLRQQLLIGAIPLHTLKALGTQLSKQKESVSDPHLREIIDDIELRAAVELAKLENVQSRQSEL